MTQESQQPPDGPAPGQPGAQDGGAPDGGAPGQPGQPPAQQPQWGQYAQPGPQPGQPQPQWGQYGQQPGYNQYVAPPKPGVIPLRPLRLGEVLDGAFQAARRNGKAMFGSALIFQLVTAALTLSIMAVGFGQFGLSLMDGSFVTEMASGSMTDAQMNGFLSSAFQVLAALLVLSLLATVAQMILQGALVIPVLRATLNRKTTFAEMWRLTRPRAGSLLLLALLYAGAVLVAMAAYLGIVIGIVLAVGRGNGPAGAFATLGLALLLSLPFLAAGIWLGIKILLAPAAIVCENLGVFGGIKRSWRLTRQNWWRTFGITALAGIIAGVIGSIVSTPVNLFLGFLIPLMTPDPSADQALTTALVAQGISAFIGALVGAITLAFESGVMALIYVDLRMRRDGFDVELLRVAETGKDDGGIPGAPGPSPYAGAGHDGGAYPPDQGPTAPYPGA